MMDQKVFSIRYNKAYLLCSKLLGEKLRVQGRYEDSSNHNLVQSVLAALPVIDLIMQQDFDERIYKPVLKSAIEETRRELFPDLAKKRFVALDKISDQLQQVESQASLEEYNAKGPVQALALKGLPPKSKVYIEKLARSHPKSLQHLKFTKNSELIKKVSLIAMLFPDQHIPMVQSFWNDEQLSEQQIIDIYKSVLAGFEKNFPSNFLKTQTQFRIKALLHFLFNDILNISEPKTLLEIESELFYEYKLNNVLRYFNYSVTKAMRYAFPKKFPHWHGGKTRDNFWDSRQNRVSAVRWLVESKLAIDVMSSGKIHINKKDFNNHGLSYLFNCYYNSASKALLEAYPALQPWQTGSMPANYWDSTHIKKAVFWMIDKMAWQVSRLPAVYNNGWLTRQTFAQFGLSGLYENRFKCNFYKLVSYVWPGRFQEWEFGNMATDFWKSAENRKKFSAWFITKFNINRFGKTTRFDSLDEAKEYRFYSSLYKYCQGDFRHLLKVYAIDLAEQNKSRLLIKKWKGLIKQEELSTMQSILTHGLFFNVARVHARQRRDSYQRMKIRLEKRV